MNRFFKSIPMPIVGLILSFAALGNLLLSYGEIYRTICYVISGIIFIIATIKFISNLEGLKQDLSTPIGASVFPTYSMGIILIGAYLKQYLPTSGFCVWIIGILLHIVLIIYFTLKFVRNFKLMQVFPSWFIVYVGIGVAAVTGKAFSQCIGQFAFIFALVCYVILLVIVSIRVFKVKQIPEPAMPTLIIYAAPGSLCLAGYLNSFDTKNMLLFWLLLMLSQAIYLIAILKLMKLLRLKFYPSYSAFTFPLIISAVALKLSTNFLIISKSIEHMPTLVKFLSIMVKIEEIVAVCIVFYVFIRYAIHIIRTFASGK